ncbi:ankyrin [Xylariaceae sp. AK1471]|nr:ankyrin [Xylariaceae sp. AK1471]
MNRIGSTTTPGIAQAALTALGQATILEGQWPELFPIARSIYLRFHHSLQPETRTPKSLVGLVADSHPLGGIVANLKNDFKPPFQELQQRFLPLTRCTQSLRRLVLRRLAASNTVISHEDLATGFINLLTESRAEQNVLLSATPDDQGTTLLHWAVRKGMHPVVKFLVDEMKFDLNVVDALLNTPLHYAVWIGDRLVTQFLIRRGASRTRKNIFGQLPVHLIYNVSSTNLKLLIERLTSGDLSEDEKGLGEHRMGIGRESTTITLLLQAIAFRRPDLVQHRGQLACLPTSHAVRRIQPQA